MNEPLTVEFEVTDELADRYARRLVERVVLPGGGWLSRPAFLVVPLVLLLPLVVGGWLPPALYVVLAVLAGGLALMSRARRSFLRGEARASVLAPFEGQTERRLRVVFTDEQIRMEAPDLQSTAAWSDLGQVVVWPDFWLLRLRAGGQFVLPAESVSADLNELIRRKAGETGADLQEDGRTQLP
ncbi:MAG: YcxB family protein [Planctomycetia bacterium]|nr:YcxB family protein [Planctomycetia bacterium]